MSGNSLHGDFLRYFLKEKSANRLPKIGESSSDRPRIEGIPPKKAKNNTKRRRCAAISYNQVYGDGGPTHLNNAITCTSFVPHTHGSLHEALPSGGTLRGKYQEETTRKLKPIRSCLIPMRHFTLFQKIGPANPRHSSSHHPNRRCY